MGGGQMAHWVLKTSETSETKARIDLNPGCKFKFVNSQETYKKRLMILGHEGTLQGPFFPIVPWNEHCWVHFGV